jgi:tetratricopeptide (TPR) repeat protein
MRRSGGEVLEETHEVSLCETLPASESIVAALANVTDPTHDISLQELSAASPGVANDMQAQAAAPAMPVRAPSARAKRWLWATGALPLLLAATFFIAKLRPPTVIPAEVPSAPHQSVSAAPEPVSAPETETSDALQATQPSVDASETSGDQAGKAVEAEERAELGATDGAALARADNLAAQGSALRKRRKLGPARSKYRAALQIYPGHARALYGLAQLAIQLHDGKQAVELTLELVRAEPDQASYSLLLGDAYRAAGKPKEAREAWQNAARQGSALARKRLK